MVSRVMLLSTLGGIIMEKFQAEETVSTKYLKH